jgi:TDG/mug DNA glycosylase family protein
MVSSNHLVTPLSRGFPPIAGAGARVLILGSLPGRKSLEMSQYYAQPQNAFWRIMGELFSAGPAQPYDERRQRLIAAGVAVWDVLAAGERNGSLDSAIVTASIVINGFQGFFEQHPDVRLVCCNGTKASELYRRYVLPTLTPPFSALEVRRLPSTSPANASIRFDSKLEQWRGALSQIAAQHRDVERAARS